MLLTSSGFDNPKIIDSFFRLVNKPVSKIKILIVTPTKFGDEGEIYIKEIQENLKNLGIEKQNQELFHLDKKINYNYLKDYDAVYICGGNTFYILSKMRECNFDKAVKEFVNERGVYFGVSAGSIIAGPDIELAGISNDWDKNKVGLKDISGLNLIDKIISPHYEPEDENIIKRFEEKCKHKLIRLKDKEAIRVGNDETSFLS